MGERNDGETGVGEREIGIGQREIVRERESEDTGVG